MDLELMYWFHFSDRKIYLYIRSQLYFFLKHLNSFYSETHLYSDTCEMYQDTQLSACVTQSWHTSGHFPHSASHIQSTLCNIG